MSSTFQLGAGAAGSGAAGAGAGSGSGAATSTGFSSTGATSTGFSTGAATEEAETVETAGPFSGSTLFWSAREGLSGVMVPLIRSFFSLASCSITLAVEAT